MTSKVALITGSARRIGAAIAKSLHDAGWRIIVHCHYSQTTAEQLCDDRNAIRKDSATYFIADLMDPAAIQTLAQNSVTAWGRLDALINNASQFVNSAPHDLSTWDQLFHCNARAPWLLSHALQSELEKTQGAIVNITDIHAHHPLKDYGVYAMTQAALDCQTCQLAKAFAPHIRVNAVAPGAILWPEGDNTLSPAVQQKIVEQSALKRHGDPNDIASAVKYLLNDAHFLTGQTIKVDGGRYL